MRDRRSPRRACLLLTLTWSAIAALSKTKVALRLPECTDGVSPVPAPVMTDAPAAALKSRPNLIVITPKDGEVALVSTIALSAGFHCGPLSR